MTTILENKSVYQNTTSTTTDEPTITTTTNVDASSSLSVVRMNHENVQPTVVSIEIQVLKWKQFHSNCIVLDSIILKSTSNCYKIGKSCLVHVHNDVSKTTNININDSSFSESNNNIDDGYDGRRMELFQKLQFRNDKKNSNMTRWMPLITKDKHQLSSSSNKKNHEVITSLKICIPIPTRSKNCHNGQSSTNDDDKNVMLSNSLLGMERNRRGIQIIRIFHHHASILPATTTRDDTTSKERNEKDNYSDNISQPTSPIHNHIRNNEDAKSSCSNKRKRRKQHIGMKGDVNSFGDNFTFFLAGKEKRHDIFAKWLLNKYGREFLSSGTGVLDVAGGKGELGIALNNPNNNSTIDNSNMIPAILLDPDPRLIVNDNGNNASSCCSYEIIPEPLCTENIPMLLSHPQYGPLIRNCSIIVGMHPDQATEAIIDLSFQLLLNKNNNNHSSNESKKLYNHKPFAMVPCCVMPKLFPNRYITYHHQQHTKLHNQQQPITSQNLKSDPKTNKNKHKIPIRSYKTFCQYLMAKGQTNNNPNNNLIIDNNVDNDNEPNNNDNASLLAIPPSSSQTLDNKMKEEQHQKLSIMIVNRQSSKSNSYGDSAFEQEYLSFIGRNTVIYSS